MLLKDRWGSCTILLQSLRGSIAALALTSQLHLPQNYKFVLWSAEPAWAHLKGFKSQDFTHYPPRVGDPFYTQEALFTLWRSRNCNPKSGWLALGG